MWHFIGYSRAKLILLVFTNSRLLCGDFSVSWNSECCMLPLLSLFLALKFLSSRIALSTISSNLSYLPIRIYNSGFNPRRKQSITSLSRFLPNSAASYYYYFVYDIRGFLLQLPVCVLHRIKHFHLPTYIFYLNLLVIGIQVLKGPKLFSVLKWNLLNYYNTNLKNLKSFRGKKDAFDCAGSRAQVFREFEIVYEDTCRKRTLSDMRLVILW